MLRLLQSWIGREDRKKPKPTRCRPLFETLEDRTAPAILGQQLFPTDNPWNQNIANAPVASNSSAILNNLTTRYGDGRLHPDFGQFYGGTNDLYGIPYNIVHSNSMARVSVVIDGYPDESDILSVPIPANAVLEGDYQNGPKVGVDNRGDSHLLIWDADTNIAYEFYRASRPSENSDGNWHADQETVWDMNTNTFRTRGYTSADAAGLSLLAGLVRPDEGLPVSQGGQGVINHAIRFTLQNSMILDQYVFPASHTANPGNNNPATQPAMGARFRLKSTVDLSSLNPQSRIIAQAMRDYGMIVADNGSNFYFSGSTYAVDLTNQRTLTWDDDDIQDSLHGLKSLRFSDFEVLDLKPIVTGLSSNQASAGTQATIVGQNFSGAAGQLKVWFGNTQATNVTYVDDTHLQATVPNGSGTVDVRVQSGVTTPADADNVNNTIWGYGISATSANDRFTFGASSGNSAPFVVTAAAASPTTVTGTTTTLSALGSDDGGEANLIYTWSIVAKPTGAADPTFSANGTNAAKSSIANFSATGAYTFRVTIQDVQSLTTTSSVNVNVSPPQVTVTPAANALLTTDRPTFTWAAIANAVSHRIYVQNQSTGAYQDIPVQATTLTLSSQQSLTPGYGYSWWVGAVSAGGSTTWSSPLSFRIAALSAPTLVGPAANAVLTNDQPTLTWNAVTGAASYKVWIADATTGTYVVYPATSTSLPLTGAQALTPGRGYTWWVASISTNGSATVWSVGRQFSAAAMAAPTLNGPANNATLNTDLPTWTWSAASGAASYKLWLQDQATGGVTVLPIASGTSLAADTPLSPVIGICGTSPPSARMARA
ncbi:MAG: IPT/TIG domain-containing protein [Gemmataceae bacterium]